ncbi:general secretion pathway protein F [Pseudoalteromonas ulvae UL12]|uniref:Secretion system protein n=1 Tax=Pseudoalteromonas ulvae TaxID=107327 RepID=A0A244CPY4_PSEDV|nr:type II secretion system F family protein [Pseudoalteromonas ulvae]MBE0365074.1 general secretion pathway protein F [Pseudoalteromonas ulvae UL12]OUL57628.1 secretion system protein [Pseudoalteromonas ulvae]
MPLFIYKAYDNSGAKVDGQIEAADQSNAIQLLKKQHLLAYEIKAFDDSGVGLFAFQQKINLADLEFLTSELSLLLESGVRIDRGLDIIRKTKAKPALAKMLSEISHAIKKGASLSAACRAHPDVFDGLYCNLIELGEASGNLSEIFAGLAKDLKFKRELQRKIIGSLTYPLVILSVCLLSIFFIFNFIIPKMADMFSDAELLPWYTQAMLSISAWMTEYQGLLILAMIALVVFSIWLSKQSGFQKWWQRIALTLPVVAKAIITVERIRFNSGLSLMVKAGVPIDQALELSAGNIKNQYLNREMQIARQKVKRGNLLTPALQQTSLYPAFYISLLEVGEESGNLERVFDEIANRSRQDFETWTDNMTTLIEPLMILFMGGFVGGVVVMMLMSMVSINDIGL